LGHGLYSQLKTVNTCVCGCAVSVCSIMFECSVVFGVFGVFNAKAVVDLMPRLVRFFGSGFESRFEFEVAISNRSSFSTTSLGDIRA
jgi:hypothetical protein